MTNEMERLQSVNEEWLVDTLNNYSGTGDSGSLAYDLEVVGHYASRGGDVPKRNPFFEQGYASRGDDNKPFLYPVYDPNNSLPVKILGYKPVGDNSAVVLSEYQGKQFLFFSPESELSGDSIGKTVEVSLAAVGTAHSYLPETDDRQRLSESSDYEQNGFTSAEDTPAYAKIFPPLGEPTEVGKSHEFFGNEPYGLFNIQNPLDTTKNLEFILSMFPMEGPEELEQERYSEFYW